MASVHMLKPYGHYGQVYVEITRGADNRGGPGWKVSSKLTISTRSQIVLSANGPRKSAPGSTKLLYSVQIAIA